MKGSDSRVKAIINSLFYGFLLNRFLWPGRQRDLRPRAEPRGARGQLHAPPPLRVHKKIHIWLLYKHSAPIDRKNKTKSTPYLTWNQISKGKKKIALNIAKSILCQSCPMFFCFIPNLPLSSLSSQITILFIANHPFYFLNFLTALQLQGLN